MSKPLSMTGVTLSTKDIGRFFSFFDHSKFTECWNWNGSKCGRKLYGKFHIKEKGYYSHRISWMIYFGHIDDNKIILHKCDNPSCVNPNHLSMGSQMDNVTDMYKKGRDRHASGERNGNAKLSLKSVAEIRRLHSSEKMTQRKIAALFGISQTTVWHILKNHIWVNP